MVNQVLMIAFHYPPYFGSSGLQRTLKFSSYLTENGWQPTILTVKPAAYSQTRHDQLSEIPDSVRVLRTWALDVSSHLAIHGRYPGFLARPDRWVSWYLSAIPVGLRQIWRSRPSLIWSTYPIPTAHVIGATLQRLSGLPWVADFRDMMLEGDYPSDARVRRHYRRIEAETVSRASKVVVTTPGTLRLYADRYPQQPRNKFQCIRNGYDEQNFADADEINKTSSGTGIRLIHSGILYPSERDPTCFYTAISELKSQGAIDKSTLTVILRATGHDEHHSSLLRQHDIGDIVKVMPGVGHTEALTEMLQADGLLIFQASNCNNQVPAKLYEYFRAGRPILALTDSDGDTARTIREAVVGEIVRLDDTEDIKKGLMRFLSTIRNGTAATADRASVQKYSRRGQAAELAQLFDELISRSPTDT